MNKTFDNAFILTAAAYILIWVTASFIFVGCSEQPLPKDVGNGIYQTADGETIYARTVWRIDEIKGIKDENYSKYANHRATCIKNDISDNQDYDIWFVERKGVFSIGDEVIMAVANKPTNYNDPKLEPIVQIDTVFVNQPEIGKPNEPATKKSYDFDWNY